ncbi:MAG: hypothetical protein WCA79_19670 [Anaerolineales bacterium]
MPKIKSILWPVLLLTASLACAIPGLSTPESNSPLDSNSLSTIVAGTANAAAMQTEQVHPATGFPRTGTAAPTENGITASALAVTATPQLVFSAYGTALGQQADGSALFVDKQLGYELVIPAGWTAFRINESEFYKLWTLPVSKEPIVQGNLTSIQSMDPNIFRLFAFDLRDGHFQSDALTNTDVSWSQTGNNYSDYISGLQKDYTSIYKSIKLVTSKTETNPSNIEVNVAELEFTYQGTKIYEKLALLKPKVGGILMIRTDTADALKGLIVPDIDQIRESVKLLSE